MNQLVRARQKPIAELPDWALCCDRVREILTITCEVLVIPNSVYQATGRCMYCGNVSPKVKIIRVAKVLQGEEMFQHGMTPVIPIDCLDFDEGLAEI
jgi:hypothetical protein